MDQDVLDPEMPETASTSTAIERMPIGGGTVVVAAEMTVDQLVDQASKIQDAMGRAMTDGVHYGVIPGTQKPTLFKAGAEKLCLIFRLAPTYDVHETYDGDHYTVRATCTLIHGPTRTLVASGEGLCTTKEKRYAVRKGGRVCPNCGAEAIIKGKAEYGGGWLCFDKKGGCRSKWTDESDQGKAFETADVSDVPNPDLPDLYNTVLKMACKRSLLAAVLNGTAASDIFTQDMEDASSPATPASTAAGPGAGATGAPGTQRGVSPENLSALQLEINRLGADQPDIWGLDAVLANCTRQFGRKIENLRDLTDREALDIIKAASNWTSFTYET